MKLEHINELRREQNLEDISHDQYLRMKAVGIRDEDMSFTPDQLMKKLHLEAIQKTNDMMAEAYLSTEHPAGPLVLLDDEGKPYNP